MYCPSCGNEISVELKYCNRCGANLMLPTIAPVALVPVKLTFLRNRMRIRGTALKVFSGHRIAHGGVIHVFY